MGKCCTPRCSFLALIVIGIVLVIIGSIFIHELPEIVHNGVDDQMLLKNGTDVYTAWVNPPVPVYMQFWVWDLVNRDDYLINGSKPILREKGPYTYREYRPKDNISFSDDGVRVSYQQPKTYVFQRSMSVGAENDTFTTVNFPLLTLATMYRYSLSRWEFHLLSLFVEGLHERLFKSYTVGQYLWGFHDPVISKIDNFTRKHFNKTLIPNETFGLFYGPTGNGTNDGLYDVYTGKINMSTQYLQIFEWNQKKSVSYWNNKYCNQINGTDGSGWHPFIQKNETLYIFSSQVCRSVYTTFDNEVNVKGIPMYRFSPPDSVLADNKTNPDNAGYCTPDCLGSGVLNVSSCRQGAPVIISQPHFYQGAKKYVDAFVGLHPTAAEHATVLDIEPITGAALNAEKKLQMNFYIRRLPLLNDTKKLNDTIFPVIWLNESGKITDEVAGQFKERVTLLVNMSHILPWVVLGVGILLVLLGVILLLVQHFRQKNDESKKSLISSGEPQANYSSTERA